MEWSDSVCLDLGNAQPVLFKAFQLQATPGLHHSQLEVSFPDASAPPRFAFATSVGSTDSRWALPDGVVVSVPPRARLCLDYHYVNPSAVPLPMGGELDVWTVEPAPGQVHAGMFAFQTTRFSLAPGVAGSVAFDCRFPTPVQIIGVYPHMHTLGTSMTVTRSGSGAGTSVASWSQLVDPPLVPFEPGLAFGGGNGLSVECDWFNSRPTTVDAGGTGADEMCLVAGFYVPGDAYLYGVDGPPADGGCQVTQGSL
jgi:hypothetical protein